MVGHVVKVSETAFEGFTDTKSGEARPGGIKRRIFLNVPELAEPVEMRFSGKAEGVQLFAELKDRLFQQVWVTVEGRAKGSGQLDLDVVCTGAGPVEDVATDAPANGRRREPLTARS